MSTATLRKSGGSLILTIPQSFTVQNRLTNGSEVSVSIHGDELIVRPSSGRKSLKDLLAATPTDNRADGWDDMPSTGAEA